MTATSEPFARAKSLEATLAARPLGLIIDGKSVPARSGKTFVTLNPATGKEICQVAEGSAADVDLAVQAARRALDNPAWRDMSAVDRSKLLNRLADLIERDAAELAVLECMDNGKPAALTQAVEIEGSIKTFRYFAGWPTKFGGETLPVSPRSGAKILNYTVREPVGVCGLIVPWNYPMSMAAWKVAPALAAGCTVILKPAEQTPLTALRLAELALEAGVPPGVFNVVTGFGEAGAALVNQTVPRWKRSSPARPDRRATVMISIGMRTGTRSKISTANISTSRMASWSYGDAPSRRWRSPMAIIC